MPFKGIRKMSKKCEESKRANTYYKKSISDFLFNKEITLSSLDYLDDEANSLNNEKEFMKINSYVLLFSEKSDTDSDIVFFQ